MPWGHRGQADNDALVLEGHHRPDTHPRAQEDQLHHRTQIPDVTATPDAQTHVPQQDQPGFRLLSPSERQKTRLFLGDNRFHTPQPYTEPTQPIFSLSKTAKINQRLYKRGLVEVEYDRLEVCPVQYAHYDSFYAHPQHSVSTALRLNAGDVVETIREIPDRARGSLRRVKVWMVTPVTEEFSRSERGERFL
jgi:hypothetical protein